ncbi:MAG: 2-succinyl-5-enolpyruvyl-6-hydroxy-3-cyclohexene-1-carboxylic-acid synthase [Longimicrobiales bacterium]
MRGENVNALWAGAFLDELARAGVKVVCVAPGSRSTPLVLAAAGDPRFCLISVVDERSAGFFALGVGKASGIPAAVITTSGTAAANLYPAVIEASQGEVPLLALTADRPHRLRDTDGNQAMDQLRLFGAFPRAFFEVAPAEVDGPSLRHLRSLAARAVALAMGSPMGPVHLNFPFEKPLEPTGSGDALFPAFAGAHPRGALGRGGDRPYVSVRPRRTAAAEEDLARVLEALEASSRGLIVAGPSSDPGKVGPAVASLGATTGFPILADPLSGARFGAAEGAQVVGGYDLFLRSPEARRTLEPDLILRVGGSATSSAVLEYLAEHGEVRQVVVDDGHRWKDHLAAAHDYVQAPPGEFLSILAGRARRGGDPEWGGLWETASTLTRQALDRVPEGDLLEGQILASVVEALPDGANLVVSSSMPVRDLDAFCPPRSRRLNVYGNRGTSGIDGLISTTLGVALAGQPDVGAGTGSAGPRAPEPRSVPTVGVLGDLAFYHDMNGLLALKALGLNVVFVVINNDGGGIFHTLPVREHEPAFTRFFATPHGLTFRKAAELYEIPYAEASTLSDLQEALEDALQSGYPRILEVRTRREATHARRRGVVEAVVETLRAFGPGGVSKEPEEE